VISQLPEKKKKNQPYSRPSDTQRHTTSAPAPQTSTPAPPTPNNTQAHEATLRKRERERWWGRERTQNRGGQQDERGTATPCNKQCLPKISDFAPPAGVDGSRSEWENECAHAMWCCSAMSTRRGAHKEKEATLSRSDGTRKDGRGSDGPCKNKQEHQAKDAPGQGRRTQESLGQDEGHKRDRGQGSTRQARVGSIVEGSKGKAAAHNTTSASRHHVIAAVAKHRHHGGVCTSEHCVVNVRGRWSGTACRLARRRRRRQAVGLCRRACSVGSFPCGWLESRYSCHIGDAG